VKIFRIAFIPALIPEDATMPGATPGVLGIDLIPLLIIDPRLLFPIAEPIIFVVPELVTDFI
jgi:hypothetical protein